MTVRQAQLRVQGSGIVESVRSNCSRRGCNCGDRLDSEPLVIRVDRLCSAVVCLNDPSLADSFSLLDSAGQKLRLNAHPTSYYLLEVLPLSGGRSEFFSVAETARSLVLHRNGREVERRRVQLHAHGTNRIE